MISLHYTAREGNYKISRLLIEKGANVNSQSNQGYTPLILAAYNGNIEIVELLMENGADKTLTDKNKKNAIDYAKENSKKDVESYLNNPVEFYNSLDWSGVNKRLLRKNRDNDYKAALRFALMALKKAQLNPGDSSYNLRIAIGNIAHMHEMIPLFEEKQLLKLTDKQSSGSYDFVKRLYSANNEKSSKLYDLIWRPLEGSLKGVKRIYLSPTGLLHKISFPAICKGQNVYLCDNYNINTQSTTAKVYMPENSEIGVSITANIYGGVNYNKDSAETEIWSYLDGTLTETQVINFFFEDKNIKTNYFTEDDASEENFKKTSPECNILHLATHGFFYPSKEEEKKDTDTNEIVSRSASSGFGVYQFVKNKNPLMRSGLVLAEANDVWQKQYSNDNEDGVLTAYEVSTIDLRKTQLVALSACETGLGDIRGTEGVYGLQRAFKMAGAKFLIMSLWEVPDKETEEFMTTFYSKLLKLKDIKQAFNQTQKEMRAKYDPYYWAAFVLIE